MYGYKIKINQLPELYWALETTVSDYMWKNQHAKDLLEICFSTFKEKTVMFNHNSFVVKGKSLSCLYGDEKVESFCESGEPITIVSIAVRWGGFEPCPCLITESDLSDNHVILLPVLLDELSLYDELDIVKNLHQIIKIFTGQGEGAKSAFLSAFFALLHKIDLITRNHIKQNQKEESNSYYIKKVDYLINTRYAEKITIQEIASILNISPNYLSAIYKDNKGITFSDQLLNVRMYHAEKMLINQNMPTAKIASLCGFCDENYFRKKFKKFFGINIRECKNIKNALTLYHATPERKNENN